MRKPSTRRNWRRPALLLAVGAGAALAAWKPLGALLVQASLHPVIPGEIYRSGQPSVSALEGWIDDYGFRTVVNLQGTQRRKPWFQAERRAAEARGLDFHVLRLHPQRMPRAQDLRRLLELIDTAPRPILLHCRLGIDRSGLAAAMALLAEGRDPAEARQQLSFSYGHAPWVSGSRLLVVLDDYERWLGRRPHSPERFHTWVQAHYAPEFYAAQIQGVALPSALRTGTSQALRFRVTNTSPRAWSSESNRHGRVFLGAHLRRLAAETDGASELRNRSRPLSLAPGERAQVELEIPAGLAAGRYSLLVDLVHEGERWFASMGSEPLQLEIDVRAAR